MTRINTYNQGLALILTLITVSAIITITVSMIGLSLQQLQLSVDARDSERAFHAASAGLECGQFVRYKESDAFLSYTPSDNDISLACMGKIDHAGGVSETPSAGSGTIYKFAYQIDQTTTGSQNSNPDTCVQIDVSVMKSATSSSMLHDFGGEIGEVYCDQFSVCTVVISRGYNRACSAAATSGYELVRELNAIF